MDARHIIIFRVTVCHNVWKQVAAAEAAFTLFFSTKGEAGTGQGLAVRRNVVAIKYGGSLGVGSEEGWEQDSSRGLFSQSNPQ